MLCFRLVNRRLKILEVGNDLREFGLALGVGAGAFGDGVFLYILSPVDFGPASTPFAAISHLSCHLFSVSC